MIVKTIETIDDYIALIVTETYHEWYYYLYDAEGKQLDEVDGEDSEQAIIRHIQNDGDFEVLPASMGCAVFSLRGGKVKSVTDRYGGELLITRNDINVLADVWYRYDNSDRHAVYTGMTTGKAEFRIGDAYGTVFVWGAGGRRGGMRITKYHLIYFYLYCYRAEDHKFRTLQIFEKGKGRVGIRYIFNNEQGKADWASLYPKPDDNKTLYVKVQTHYMDEVIDISEYFDRAMK